MLMWKQRNKSDFVAPLYVKFFSECGNFRSGWSPLLLAASNGHLELVKIFLDVNARVDVFDQVGWTWKISSQRKIDHSSPQHNEIIYRRQDLPCTWRQSLAMRTSVRCCLPRTHMWTARRRRAGLRCTMSHTMASMSSSTPWWPSTMQPLMPPAW